ncbi:MAG: inositol monophosphatase [Patescibacteria group bacterium]
MSESENYLEFAKELAEEAGKIMQRYFRAEDTGTTIKGDSTPVTVADTKINDLVIEQIKNHFPNHAVLGEEASHKQQSDYLWVCDPIDGTMPYSIGIPISTFNLALIHDGQPIIAVQKDPFTDRLYWAKKAGGAYLNGEKLKMTGKFLGRSPVNCEIYANEYNSIFSNPNAESEIQTALKTHDFVLMKMISIGNSIGLVASGNLAAAVFSNSHVYEAATGSLLISEAGGKFTNLLGEVDSYNQKIKGFIAAPEPIHNIILKAVKPIAEKYLSK